MGAECLGTWSVVLSSIQPLTHSASCNETTHSDKQIFKFWLIVFSLKNPPIIFFKELLYIFLKNPPNPYELTLPLIGQIGMFLLPAVLDGISTPWNQVFLS